MIVEHEPKCEKRMSRSLEDIRMKEDGNEPKQQRCPRGRSQVRNEGLLVSDMQRNTNKHPSEILVRNQMIEPANTWNNTNSL